MPVCITTAGPPPEIFSSTTAETVPSVGHSRCSINTCCKKGVIKARLDGHPHSFLPVPSPLSQHGSPSSPTCIAHHPATTMSDCTRSTAVLLGAGRRRVPLGARGRPGAEGIVFLPQAPQHLNPTPLSGSCAIVLWLLVGPPATASDR